MTIRCKINTNKNDKDKQKKWSIDKSCLKKNLNKKIVCKLVSKGKKNLRLNFK